MDAKIYIFSLDYGKRSDEKLFIKEILRNFDKDTVVLERPSRNGASFSTGAFYRKY